MGNLNKRLLLAISVVAIWSISVFLRLPNFGKFDAVSDRQIWLSDSTELFVNNWINEGAFKLRFVMIWFPKSIEFEASDFKQSLFTRQIYFSYPSGSMLLPWIMGELKNGPINMENITTMSLLNHLIIALVLSQFIYWLSSIKQKVIPPMAGYIFALSGGILALFSPTALYFLQNVWFADQAIILPSILMMIAEVKRFHYSNKSQKAFSIQSDELGKSYRGKARIWTKILMVLIFLGAITDWYTFIIIGIIWIIRLMVEPKIKSIIKNTVILGIPSLAGLGLFFWQQVIYLGNLKGVLGTGSSRSFFSKDPYCLKLSKNYFWDHHMISNYTKYGTYILIILLALCLLIVLIKVLKHKTNKAKLSISDKTINYITLLLVTAPMVRISVLKCHSMIHDFVTLIFLSSFVLLPIIFIIQVLSLFQNTSLKNKKNYFIIFLSILFLIFSIAYARLAYKEYYPKLLPYDDVKTAEIAKFVKQNTAYNDVVFSFDYEIGFNPPGSLSVSNKQVKLVKSKSEIKNFLSKLSNQNYQIKILTIDESEQRSEEYQNLLDGSDSNVKNGDTILYTVFKEQIFEE